MSMRRYLSRMKGGGSSQKRHSVQWLLWSLIGGFLGISAVAYLNQLFALAESDKLFLIGSFGASAVLVYGTPHVLYAQPRNLVGGHLISALVGVTVSRYIELPVELQAACAVAFSILLMHLTITLHPPGGASALIAVLGSEQVQQMGYLFVLQPVLTGVTIMLVVALLVNNLSSDHQRHYPKNWW